MIGQQSGVQCSVFVSGIPAGVEQQPAPAARSPASATPPAAGVPTGGVASTQPASQGPNAQPLDMFAPQVTLTLEL